MLDLLQLLLGNSSPNNCFQFQDHFGPVLFSLAHKKKKKILKSITLLFSLPVFPTT